MNKATRFLPILLMFFVSIAAQGQFTDDRLASKTTKSVSPYPTSVATPFTSGNNITTSDPDSSNSSIDTRYKNAVIRLKQQAKSIKEYAMTNHYNTEYCFLIDMSIPSGKNRFFVYSLKKDEVEYSTLVSHGAGSFVQGSEQLEFSNVPNSF